MSKHLVDTRPKVATCNRCGRVVLAAMAGGCRAAVDPKPLTFKQTREHLIGAVDVYRMYITGGRPTRLELFTITMAKSPAAKYGFYAVSHGCGCHAMDATAFEETEDPSEAPVRPSGAAQPTVPVPGAAPLPSRPSERRTGLPAIRCAECKGLIPEGDPDRFMIEIPVWQTNVHKVPTRGTRKGYERTYEGWGVSRWAIHASPTSQDGCPTPPRGGGTSALR